ncbi:nitroreductase family protein [Streptomyces sp. A5-4]|uniref:nitroreductase family protein n=1 Tax=Streptomyces sp. A5-4 TaxID=3384771 RepID=UPI003DA902A8
MDVMTAVLSRRSEHHLVEPAPNDQEFAYLLRVAATAPDHGGLRPWRLILIRNEGHTALQRPFADRYAGTQTRPGNTQENQRAPLLVTVVFSPLPIDTEDPASIPEWEQLAATTAMTNSLALLLHARGFGSNWHSGKNAETDQVRQAMGLRHQERLLGWLRIGTPQQSEPPKRQATKDITHRISNFRPL